MKASIVIRAYNAAATIERAILSALSQDSSGYDHEMIIVDDGSRDATASIIDALASDPRIRIVHQENQGAIRAANVGFKMARGEFVSLLDGDDAFEPSYLSAMIAACERDPAADFAYSDYFEEFEGRRALTRVPELCATIADNVLYRTARLAKVGFYRDDVFFAEYDLLLRTMGIWRGVHVERPLVTYHRRRESLTGDKSRLEKGLRQLTELHPDKADFIARIRSYELSP